MEYHVYIDDYGHARFFKEFKAGPIYVLAPDGSRAAGYYAGSIQTKEPGENETSNP